MLASQHLPARDVAHAFLVPDHTLPCACPIHLQDLIKKLDEVTQNSEIVEIRQKESECELEAARDRVQQQATEILLKASKRLLSSVLSMSANVARC